MNKARIVVVGGGIAGMAAAYYLERLADQSGHAVDVTLVERDARLGGRVGTECVDGYLLDTGPDSFMSQKPWAVQLCQELGMGDEIISPLSRRFYLLIRGRLHSVPHELVSLVPTKPEALWKASFLSPFAKLRASSEGLVRPQLDREDESLAAFMRRRFGRQFALRFAEPLMGGVHAGHPEEMSMASVYPMYWQMERKHGSVTRAIIERRLAARKSGSAQTTSPFVALRHGMSSFVDRLAGSLQDTEVLLSTEVQALETLPNGRMRVSMGDPTSTGAAGSGSRLVSPRTIEADFVLLACPSYASADLVRPLAPQAAELLDKIRYASTAVVSLAYRREDVANPLAGRGFLVPRGEPQPITGFTWSSNKWEGRAPEGMVLMRAFMGHAGNDQFVVDQSEEELEVRCHRALAGLLGIKGQPVLRRVYRWLRAMPQYDVGHLSLLDRIEQELAPFPAIHLTGSSYRGVGVPDCVRQGKESAEKIMRKLVQTGRGGEAEAEEAEEVPFGA
jgi:oxygen-dependent protoporphyrinogen oxidase